MLRRVLIALCATVSVTTVQADAVDPATVGRGAKIFEVQCSTCHTVDRDGYHTVGPNLWGVFGRRAGSLEDFGYSPALQKSGIVWTPAVLDAWLADPGGYVPGTRMAFAGLASAEERHALIVFLERATTEGAP